MTVSRTDPDKHREQVRAANRARHRATKTLIERHRDEWDGLYAVEAAKEGVEPKPRDTAEVINLRGQIAELQSQLAEVAPKRRRRAVAEA